MVHILAMNGFGSDERRRSLETKVLASFSTCSIEQ